MNILVVLGHPDPNSFNHAMAAVVVETLQSRGHDVAFHDLYAEGFDSHLPKEELRSDGAVPALIQKHCDELQAADGIVVVHPNWWGQPPAILKGWIDRVIRPGVAYRFEEHDSGEGVPVGLLKAQAALVLNTANTPAEREQAVFGDPLEAIWKCCIFDLCGVHNVHRRMFGVIVTSTESQRRQWLSEVRALTLELFPGKEQAAMIRRCCPSDLTTMGEIINDAAQAYRGVIPADRWHDPYMPQEELETEIRGGVEFWGIEDDGLLAGVMGIQDKGDVCLIRHAYVRTGVQKSGIGSRLLRHLEAITDKPILIGTWAAAIWAIAFYQKNGYALVTEAEKDRLLTKYWRIPDRQIETSVVLADGKWSGGL